MSLRPALMLAAVALAVGFSSCTREYTCKCGIKYSGSPGLPDSTTKSYPIRDTKSNAKSICEQNSSSADANGIHSQETCTLY